MFEMGRMLPGIIVFRRYFPMLGFGFPFIDASGFDAPFGDKKPLLLFIMLESFVGKDIPFMFPGLALLGIISMLCLFFTPSGTPILFNLPGVTFELLFDNPPMRLVLYCFETNDIPAFYERHFVLETI